MSKRRSKVHPNYKTRYRVRNWPDYDRALRRRGDLTIWLTPAAIAAWTPLGTGARGGVVGTEARSIHAPTPWTSRSSTSSREDPSR